MEDTTVKQDKNYEVAQIYEFVRYSINPNKYPTIRHLVIKLSDGQEIQDSDESGLVKKIKELGISKVSRFPQRQVRDLPSLQGYYDHGLYKPLAKKRLDLINQTLNPETVEEETKKPENLENMINLAGTKRIVTPSPEKSERIRLQVFDDLDLTTPIKEGYQNVIGYVLLEQSSNPQRQSKRVFHVILPDGKEIASEDYAELAKKLQRLGKFQLATIESIKATGESEIEGRFRTWKSYAPMALRYLDNINAYLRKDIVELPEFKKPKEKTGLNYEKPRRIIINQTVSRALAPGARKATETSDFKDQNYKNDLRILKSQFAKAETADCKRDLAMHIYLARAAILRLEKTGKKLALTENIKARLNHLESTRQFPNDEDEEFIKI